MKRTDIKIKYSHDCDECDDNPLVISGYYQGDLIYSMCYHKDTVESKQEIRDIVIDSSLDILDHEETEKSLSSYGLSFRDDMD